MNNFVTSLREEALGWYLPLYMSDAVPANYNSSYLDDLNFPQREAAMHLLGPILVLAGAGSGKTRVLTRRIAHLVLAHRVRPNQILAVTFTNKATDEMRERLHKLLGEQAEMLWVATFHSAALRMLRRNAEQLSYKNDFVVYDDQDTKSVLKQILKDLNIDEKKFPTSIFSRAIDAAKNALVGPDDFVSWLRKTPSNTHDSKREDAAVQQQAEVYQYYQRALVRANAMDFGDLVMNAVLILRGVPAVRNFYQHQLQFVLVDEFQDTNHAQYEFVRLLTESHRNLLVVGDDDQSIYAFRGATIRNILEFEKDFTGARVVTLDQNYRSTGNILSAAHEVIRHNNSRKEKKLWTAAAAGDKIRTFVGSDELEEALFIATEIRVAHEAGLPFKKIAIFYRTNAQSRAIEEAFIQARIPYRIFGGLKFYERKEVKDIIAYLRLVLNESDDQALLRTINTPPRGIGAQTVQGIIRRAQEQRMSYLAAAKDVANQSKSVRKFVELIEDFQARSTSVLLSTLIHDLVEASEYGPRLRELGDLTSQSRLENLLELEAIGRSIEGTASDPRETLHMFLDRIALTSGADVPSESLVDEKGGKAASPDDTVSMMTLHLAKGLEFPTVFFSGLEEGLLPHYRSIYDPAAVEEERRLCYVGITRAMERLYLTRALSRGMFASGGDGYGGLYREKSRFLYDIPDALTEQVGYQGQWNADSASDNF